MNNNTTGSGDLVIERFNGIGYLFVIPFAVFLVVGMVSLVSYVYRILSSPSPSRQDVGHRETTSPAITIDVGLNEEEIRSFPILVYSTAKYDNKEDSSCCTICLSDYKKTDMVRLLPECRHIFHMKCVDPWLRLHATCPVCRSTPLTTPLAEVVPLAHHQV